MKKAVALYFFCVLMTCYTAGAATMTISADKDTYIDKVLPYSKLWTEMEYAGQRLFYKASKWAASF